YAFMYLQAFIFFDIEYYEFFILILLLIICFFFFFFNDTATTEIYTLSLHDALPISFRVNGAAVGELGRIAREAGARVIHISTDRSEEHTSELQSRSDLVCRLLLEKKKKKKKKVKLTDKDL